MTHDTCGTYLKTSVYCCPYCGQVWCPHCRRWFTPPGSPRVLRDITLIPPSTMANDRERTKLS